MKEKIILFLKTKKRATMHDICVHLNVKNKSDVYNVEYKIRLKGSISVCETLNGNELNAKAPTSTLCVDIIVDEKSPNFFASPSLSLNS